MTTRGAALAELRRVSLYAGRRLDLAQAGGGNTSIKLTSGTMYAKASGVRLDAVGAPGAVVAVRLDGLRGGSARAIARWDDQCRARVSGPRPSVEVALHALLGRVVLHTHPVAVNALLCARSGARTLQRALRAHSPILVPYYRPGVPLAAALARRLRPGEPLPSVVLLRNHGVIVSGASAAAVVAVHEAVTRAAARLARWRPAAPRLSVVTGGAALDTLRALLGPDAVVLSRRTRAAARARAAAVLFPDAAVYCGARAFTLVAAPRATLARRVRAHVARWGTPPAVWRRRGVVFYTARTLAAARAVAEVDWAQEEIERLTARFGGPRWLGPGDVRALVRWEAEAYRRRVAER